MGAIFPADREDQRPECNNAAERAIRPLTLGAPQLDLPAPGQRRRRAAISFTLI